MNQACRGQEACIVSIRDWRSIGGGCEVAECELPIKKAWYRLVVVRKRVPDGERKKKQLKFLDLQEYEYQAIVTNSLRLPENVWRFYNQRACCENFIKEGIYSLGLDTIVSHCYAGNKAFFEVVMFSYNLFNFFKEEALGQREKKDMAETIRERLLRIPGRLVSTGGQKILRLAEGWFHQHEFQKALSALI